PRLDELEDQVDDLARVLLRGLRSLVDPLDDVCLRHFPTPRPSTPPRRTLSSLAEAIRRSRGESRFHALRDRREGSRVSRRQVGEDLPIHLDSRLLQAVDEPAVR